MIKVSPYAQWRQNHSDCDGLELSPLDKAMSSYVKAPWAIDWYITNVLSFAAKAPVRGRRERLQQEGPEAHRRQERVAPVKDGLETPDPSKEMIWAGNSFKTSPVIYLNEPKAYYGPSRA